MNRQIRWVRILIGGFLAEAAIFAVVIPVFKLWGRQPLLYIVPPLALVLCFLFGLWVGQGADSYFVLHGVLVGMVATLLYIGLTFARPEPFAYILAHALKILGGAGGGSFAGRRRAAPAATNLSAQ